MIVCPLAPWITYFQTNSIGHAVTADPNPRHNLQLRVRKSLTIGDEGKESATSEFLQIKKLPIPPPMATLGCSKILLMPSACQRRLTPGLQGQAATSGRLQKQCRRIRTVCSDAPNLLSHDARKARKRLPQPGRGALKPTARKWNERERKSRQTDSWGEHKTLPQDGHRGEAGSR